MRLVDRVPEGKLSVARTKKRRDVKAEINGVRGLFILDTGASYVALKSGFADRAKIPQTESQRDHADDGQRTGQGETCQSRQGALGRLEAINVPVAVQKVDDKSYGVGVDGCSA